VWRPRLGVRARLTAWYAASFGLLLLLFSLAVYSFVRSSLDAQMARQIADDYELVVHTIRTARDEIFEIEAHRSVAMFFIEEDGWPIHISGGWALNELERTPVIENEPQNLSWTTRDHRHFDVRKGSFQFDGHHYVVGVARDTEELHQGLERLALTIGIAFPLALAAALLGGWFFATRVLKPVAAITRKAREITADRLNERLPVDDADDEFGHLAAVFNATLARLQDAFERLRRFTSDASHELRTPLAVIRSVGELSLKQDRDPAAYRESLGSILEEVDRLSRLLDALLVLTRAESASIALQQGPLDLSAMAERAMEDLRVLAEEKSQTLETQLDRTVLAFADETTVRQALLNLIGNAIRYTPEHGRIRVRVQRASDGRARLAVEDNGPGIAPEHQSRIFDRFYRIDQSRSAATGGAGLGLAIARWAIELNEGEIMLQSEPGHGSTFAIVLPFHNARVSPQGKEHAG